MIENLFEPVESSNRLDPNHLFQAQNLLHLILGYEMCYST